MAAAAAAAGGIAGIEPVSPINLQVLHWYIKMHQTILRNILGVLPNKVRYYGGFSLNIALACKNIPDGNELDECYKNGIKKFKKYLETQGIVGIEPHASDIDATILGVPVEAEYMFLTEMLAIGLLTMGIYVNPPIYSIPGAQEVCEKATKRAAPYSVSILLGPDQLKGTPVKYVVGHILPYYKHSVAHYQLILTGIFQEKGVWKSQVLSELTPSPEENPGGTATFINTPIPILRTQFQALSTFLATTTTRRNSKRKKKTNARVGVIDAVLSKVTAAGGGTRRVR